MMRRFDTQLQLLFYFILISSCAAVLTPQGASAQGGSGRGEQIFQTKCSPCHTIGGGRKVGPDLQGVTKQLPAAWLFSFISDPDKMFSQNDPTAAGLLAEYKIRMPNTALTPDDVNAVISYLKTKAGAAPEAKAEAPAVAETKAPPSGADAERGRKYFIGELVFQNGGPPCMACHAVSGMKYFGGGSLGPDLTQAYPSLGGGITSVLINVPFPTMKPIFDAHPLTTQEAQDLTAFFQKIGSEHRENYTGRIVAASLIAFTVLIAIIHLVWRRRLVSVRKAMVERANREVGHL